MLFEIVLAIVLVAGGLAFFLSYERDPISIGKEWTMWVLILCVVIFLILWLLATGKWILASLGIC